MMPDSPLRIGDHVVIDKTGYVVDRLHPDGLSHILRPDSGGLEAALTPAQFEHAWAAGRIEFSSQDLRQLPTHLQLTMRRSLSAFSATETAEMHRKMDYCDAVSKDLALGERSKRNVDAIVKLVADRRGERVAPHYQSILEWLRRWEPDRDIRSLAPGNRSKGNRKSKIVVQPEEVSMALKAACLWMLDKRSMNVTSGYAQVDAELRKRCGFGNYTLPTYSTFYRAWRRFNHPAKVNFREGKRALRKLLPAGSGVDVSRPLERVEIDWTSANVIVVDEVHHVPLGVPWIAIAICCHTRMVVGFHISFTPPSWASAAQCLAHAMSPKSSQIAKYNADPEFAKIPIRNPWPVFGVPENVVVDCDQSWNSKSMKETCFALGCNLIQMPPYSPELKGTIERFNLTLKQGLFDLLPGQRLKPKRKYQKEYKAEEQAAMTLKALQFMITKWICDIYHMRDHKGFEA